MSEKNTISLPISGGISIGEQRHARVRALFDHISVLAASDQESALCAANGDEEERLQVRKLLDGHRRQRLFGVTAAHWVKELDNGDDRGEALIGKKIGSFEIMKFIGHGGSSIVFLAQRKMEGAVQDVALKLLNSGLFSNAARRRFRREQAILSRLSHPHIARLIDAGISDFGSPFIAMEYVDGVDLISFATSHGLDLSARLKLLIDTCRAVDAAHRSLIVHRDLKPSNVLVSADGSVKVLDFGIAKLIDEGDTETITQHIALTPAYAAPEQFRPGPAATSMDVFSLGVLSSELLLGGRLGPDATLPSSEPAEIWRRWRKIDGDLAHIVRAALSSDPRRRYTSAGHMADDFCRYLRREPIQIVPLSQGYRLRKFVSRHRGGVAAGILLAIAIIGGTVGIAYQASVAREQADVARRQAMLALEQATRANEVRDFLLAVFKAGGADLPRNQRPSIEDIVDSASHKLLSNSGLADNLRLEMLLTLAEVSESIGAYERAEGLLDEVDSLVAQIGPGVEEAALKSRVLRAGGILTQTALSEGEKVVAILEPVRTALESSNNETEIEGSLYLANGFEYEGRVQEALDMAKSAVARAKESRNPELLLTAMERQASLTCETSHHHEAIVAFQAAMAVWEGQGRPDLPVTVNLFGGMAIAKQAAADMQGAEDAYKQAIAAADRFYDQNNATTPIWLHYYGLFLIAQSRPEEARPYLDRAFKITQELYGESDSRSLQSISAMASLSAVQENYGGAIEWATLAIDICMRHGTRGNSLAKLIAMRARFEASAGQLQNAEKDVALALAERKSVSLERDPSYAAILDVRLDIEVRQNRYAAALKTADEILAINKPVGGSPIQTELLTRFNRAKALLALHQTTEALSEIREIELAYAQIEPSDRRRFAMAAFKVDALEQAAQHEEAKDAAKAALALVPPTVSASERSAVLRLRELTSQSAK